MRHTQISAAILLTASAAILATVPHMAVAASEQNTGAAESGQHTDSRWWNALADRAAGLLGSANVASGVVAKAEHVAAVISKSAEQVGKIAYSSLGMAGSKVASEVDRIADLTRGATSGDREFAQANMEKLRNAMVKAGGNPPQWPDTLFDANSDPMVARYIYELNQAARLAHSELSDQIALHLAVIEPTVRGFLSTRLPLAGMFSPVVAFLLIYLICDVWRRKAAMRRRARMQMDAARVGAVASRAFQQECDLVSDAITTTCAYLAILPITTILLMVMEINGTASWLISSSYMCLIAATAIAAQPSFLASIWSRQSLIGIGQRLAIGIMTITGTCCFIHAVRGDTHSSGGDVAV
ncbi:hypothetical protein GQ54DRAFT_295957 [Martensiomyces pterosporus]|nr:hypothetical protein GQ54DRAFT_295957 [Martensiomyces pterosporus]